VKMGNFCLTLSTFINHQPLAEIGLRFLGALIHRLTSTQPIMIDTQLNYKVKDISLAEWGRKKLDWPRPRCQA